MSSKKKILVTSTPNTPILIDEFAKAVYPDTLTLSPGTWEVMMNLTTGRVSANRHNEERQDELADEFAKENT